MKHTNRKWSYTPQKIGPQKVIYNTPEAEGVLATVNPTGDFTIEEIEDIAKLIAAAPETKKQRDELLEAMDKIVKLAIGF